MGPLKPGAPYIANFVDVRADGTTTIPDLTGLTVKQWTVTDAKSGATAGTTNFNPAHPNTTAFIVYGDGPVTVNIEFSNGSRVSSPPIQVLVNPINRQAVTI